MRNSILVSVALLLSVAALQVGSAKWFGPEQSKTVRVPVSIEGIKVESGLAIMYSPADVIIQGPRTRIPDSVAVQQVEITHSQLGARLQVDLKPPEGTKLLIPDTGTIEVSVYRAP